MRNAVIKGKSTQYVVMKWLWLHTSLNVLWGTWEIPALPPQKEAFDVAGSPEEAHRAGLKQKNTLPVSVTPACKPSWMWAKINQGATGTCIYSSSAKITVHWERPEHSQCSKRSWCEQSWSWWWATVLGKIRQTVLCTCPLEENTLVIWEAERLKNSQSTVGSLPGRFKGLICFECVECLIYNI